MNDTDREALVELAALSELVPPVPKESFCMWLLRCERAGLVRHTPATHLTAAFGFQMCDPATDVIAVVQSTHPDLLSTILT